MTSWWKRTAAALKLGTIWGLAAGAMAAVVGGITGLFVGGVLQFALVSGVIAGTIGLMLGTGFASVLSVMERNRTLDELSTTRAGAWGFVAGAGLPLLVNVIAIVVGGLAVPVTTMLPALLAGAVMYGGIAGALAAGTVAIAKMAPHDRELEPGSEQVRIGP